MHSVAVLFARADSIYKTMPECDVYDIDRDARTWPGGLPIVAHPPCRAWGGLRAFAKPRPDEKGLALFAVDLLRVYGGVLEHPKASTLWPAAGLPEPGERDAWGGFTIELNQHWFGHRAEKATRLYIVGCEFEDLPDIPIVLTRPTHVVANSRNLQGTPDARPEVTKREREATPPPVRLLVGQRSKEMQGDTIMHAAGVLKWQQEFRYWVYGDGPKPADLTPATVPDDGAAAQTEDEPEAAAV